MNSPNKPVLILRLIATIKTIYSNLAIQRTYLGKKIQPILSLAASENDGSLDESDFKKITHYYALAVPAVLGEAICALHSKRMSEQERIAATAQGAMTGLFDDFFDKEYLSESSIENLLSGGNSSAKKSNEKLFDVFYKTSLQTVPDKKNMQQRLMEVYNAQLESKKQASAFVALDEIQRITYYKGGASLLFYRSAFLPETGRQEEKLVYDLGSMMQLCNDIFDVYKDSENKIKTLVTEAKHIKPLRELLLKEVLACCAKAFALGFPEKNTRKFLAILSLGIFSRAFVCLDQLEQNEALTNGSFEVTKYSRKQLICDMDILKNKLSSARYHNRLMKSAMSQ